MQNIFLDAAMETHATCENKFKVVHLSLFIKSLLFTHLFHLTLLLAISLVDKRRTGHHLAYMERWSKSFFNKTWKIQPNHKRDKERLMTKYFYFEYFIKETKERA